MGGETTGEMAYIWGRIGRVKEERRGEKFAIWGDFFGRQRGREERGKERGVGR